jgi:hypothetical protein
MLSEANTKVGGRFGMKRCGPSSRRARSASAVFKTFVLHPKNTFATKSARSSHAVVSRFRAFTQPMIAGGAPNPMVQDYGPTMREILAATKRRK